jgi:hypothetical protein
VCSSDLINQRGGKYNMSKLRKDTTVTELVIKKGKDKNIRKSILEVDDMVNHHLELLDVNVNKEAIMKQAIKDINQTSNRKRIIKNKDGREYFDSLNDYLKGKLFYIAFKESSKYMKIPDIEKIVDKQTLINFIKEIEVGQEYAWALIDNLRNEKLKNFLYGIFTYLYF